MTSAYRETAATRCRASPASVQRQRRAGQEGHPHPDPGEGCTSGMPKATSCSTPSPACGASTSATAARNWAQAAAKQMTQLAYYNSFFRLHHRADRAAGRQAGRADARAISTTPSSATPARKPTTPSCAWSGTSGPCRTSRDKNIFIGRHNGYHGSTMAGASLGGMKGMHAQGGLPIPDIHHIDQPYWFGEGGDLSPEEFGLQRAQRTGGTRSSNSGPDRVAAFIGEPIQGAAGVFIPPMTLLAGNRAHLPQVRRAAGRRRSDLRLRPHRRIGSARSTSASSRTS